MQVDDVLLRIRLNNNKNKQTKQNINHVSQSWHAHLFEVRVDSAKFKLLRLQSLFVKTAMFGATFNPVTRVGLP